MLTKEQVEKIEEIREKVRAFVFERVRRDDALVLLQIISDLQAKLKEVQEAAGPILNKLQDLQFVGVSLQMKMCGGEIKEMDIFDDLRHLAEAVGRGNEY